MSANLLIGPEDLPISLKYGLACVTLVCQFYTRYRLSAISCLFCMMLLDGEEGDAPLDLTNVKERRLLRGVGVSIEIADPHA